MRVIASLLLLLLLSTADAATNSISVSKSCFALGESVIASFNVVNPQVGDWIGLIQSSADVIAGGVNFPQFVFTCGTATCSGSSASGRVTIFNSLPIGTYKAVLLRDNFAVLAVSSNFGIHTTCTATPPTRPPPTTPTRPNPSPVRRPTAVRPTRPSINLSVAQQALNQASAQIAVLVKKDKTLLPQFLRMVFHDCHEKCDGCIDLSNTDNGRLNNPINALAPIVLQFATPDTGLSRADIWVQAMYTALNLAKKGNSKPITFTMNWVGRVDCEDANIVCKNSQGQTGCSATSGPHRPIASVNLNSAGFANFWAKSFNGMTLQQGTALIGCHAVGRLTSQVSGINGPNGWAINNTDLTNEYYQALLGSNAKPNMDAQSLFTVSPDWRRTFQDNSGTGIPSRNFFSLFAAGKKIVMTNADVAIARQLDSSNMDSSTGAVSCAFNPNTASKGAAVCPIANNVNIVTQFTNIDTWLSTLKSALDRMVTNGYTRNSCGGPLCTLS